MRPFFKSLIFSAIIILSACTLDNPGMPVWENELVIALPGDTYEMQGLIDDTLIFAQPGADSAFDYVWISVADSASSENKEHVNANDLSSDPTSKHYSQTIGNISLGNLREKNTANFTISQLFGTSFPPDSPLPPSPVEKTYPIEDQAFVDFDDFQEATIETADLIVTAVNGLFLDISSITVNVYDDTDMGKVFVSSIDLPGPILAHSEVSNADNPIKLTNLTLSNHLITDFVVTLPPRDTTYILDEEKLSESIHLKIRLQAVEVSRSIAEIPVQNIVKKDSSKAGNSDDQLSYAYINKGLINVSFISHLPVSGRAVVTFNDIYKNGTNVRISKEIIANDPSPQNIVYDLRGAEITNKEDPASTIKYFKYTVDIDTDSSDGMIEINADDSISAVINTDTLYFDNVEGVINNREIEISPYTKSDIADYGNLEPGFRFSQAKLVLKFYNEIGIDVTANLKITGKHKDKDTGLFTDAVTVEFNDQIIHGSPDGFPRLTELVLDKNQPSPNMVDLMEILPTDISISGSAFINGEGSVKIGQAMWVDYELSTPLSFEITEPIVLESEKTTIDTSDIDTDTQTFIRDKVQSANVELFLDNALPVGVQSKIYVSKDSLDLFSDSIADSSAKFILDNVVIPAATTDANGLVTDPLKRTIHVELSRQNLDLLANVPVYSGIKTIIDSTDGEAVFRATDFFKTRGIIRVRFRVETNKD